MKEREKFEKWYVENSFRAIGSRDCSLQWEAWQAALSTRKQHGFGIVDKYGKSRFSYGLFGTKEQAESECYYMNEPVKNVTPILGSPFRVVELFYEDSES